ncbi:MAG: histidine kinase [Pseudomonadales bacterium]|jgi:two-component system sensor histidine kinase AlgZ|nr:histidine kinase [Pseudomonadales bacterium]MDP6469875.1 histidine kinase [Pseudomonadales bacterium]MDP6827522.1 histidine kinase [Pseudomonadales bacterium]MDP6971345.1 histidine kinase [Pseudomonadales bacterium]
MSERQNNFVVPDLCNVGALSLLVLAGQLLTVVLLLAGGPVTWVRFALMSLFVQWVTLASAGTLCVTKDWLSRFALVPGSLIAFGVVMTITLIVGVAGEWLLGDFQSAFDWRAIGAQLTISGVITGLALRYFYVQTQLRAQEQSELQSRIQALQSRIRPHFLFNSMNIIASLIETDPETAESVVEDLSELFRASLNEADNLVQLKDELNLCERYVRIESLRLGNRLRMNWEVAPPPQVVKVPLLTLQPLLENAIYHGIQPLPEGGTITVRVFYDEDLVNVDITNPLPEDSDRSQSQGNRMAINNIRSRLQVLYGARAELSSEEKDGCYHTRLRFPALLEEDPE